MNKKTLIEDTENMETIMSRTAEPCDIWQDRFIYDMAKTIWHILQHIYKKEYKDLNNEK